VLVCLWLEVAIATLRQDTSLSIAANAGRIRAAAYFYHFKLPKIGACLQVVAKRDSTCADMADAEF